MLMPTTIIKGPPRTGTPPESEIAGKVCMIIRTKKYKFAIFENCSNIFFGKKEAHEYLTVEMLFPTNGSITFSFSFFGGSTLI